MQAVSTQQYSYILNESEGFRHLHPGLHPTNATQELSLKITSYPTVHRIQTYISHYRKAELKIVKLDCVD